MAPNGVVVSAWHQALVPLVPISLVPLVRRGVLRARARGLGFFEVGGGKKARDPRDKLPLVLRSAYFAAPGGKGLGPPRWSAGSSAPNRSSMAELRTRPGSCHPYSPAAALLRKAEKVLAACHDPDRSQRSKNSLAGRFRKGWGDGSDVPTEGGNHPGRRGYCGGIALLAPFLVLT